MRQRLVIWTASQYRREIKPDSPVVINLDPNVLARENPELAKAIGNGRITSHSTVAIGDMGPVITFIVDDW